MAGGKTPARALAGVDAVSGPEHNTNVILKTKLLQLRHTTSPALPAPDKSALR